MPRIPLYNQGQGLTTRMATGALSPRANVGAFTAPGQAQARLASQAGQIAFDFGMAQKNAETRREQDEYFTQFSREFAEYNRNDKQTDTTKYRDDFKKFSDEKLNTIDARTDLTNSQKNKIKQSLSSTILSYSNSGENKAFNRGQIIRTEKAVGSISEKINQASLVPKGHADRVRLLSEIEKDLTGYNLNGLRTGYSIQSIKKGFEALDLGKQIDAATSASQLDKIALEVPKSTLNASTQQKIKNRIKTRKSEIRAKAYDDNVGIVNSLSVNFEDKEPLEDAILKGEVQSFTTDGGQTVVVDTSELSNTQRSNLVRSYVNPLFKDLVDNTQQNAVDELSEVSSQDLLSVANRLFTPEYQSENNTTSENMDEALAEFAEQLSQQAANEATSGEGDAESILQKVADAENILQSSISPNGVLSERVGGLGDKAARTLSRLASVRGAVAKGIQDNSKMDALRDAAKVGNLANASIQKGVTSDDIQMIVRENLVDLKDSPQAQLDFLQRNGVISEDFQTTLVKHKGRLSDPNKTDIDDEDRFAIMLFRNMELRDDLLHKHLNKTDLAWWQSFETLSDIYGDEGALQQMRLQRDIDPEKFSKELDNALDVTEAQLTKQPWYKFDLDPPQNTGYLKQEIRDLAKEYLKQSMQVVPALERAGDQIQKRHILIGSVLVPKLPEFDQGGELQNIKEISELVIDDFSETYSQLLEDSELEKENIGLLNIEGTADRFYLVRDGGFPIQTPDGKYVSFTKQELLKLDKQAKAKQIEDARNQINEAIRQNALKKQRQANVEDIDAFEIEVIN